MCKVCGYAIIFENGYVMSTSTTTTRQVIHMKYDQN